MLKSDEFISAWKLFLSMHLFVYIYICMYVCMYIWQFSWNGFLHFQCSDAYQILASSVTEWWEMCQGICHYVSLEDKISTHKFLTESNELDWSLTLNCKKAKNGVTLSLTSWKHTQTYTHTCTHTHTHTHTYIYIYIYIVTIRIEGIINSFSWKLHILKSTIIWNWKLVEKLKILKHSQFVKTLIKSFSCGANHNHQMKNDKEDYTHKNKI